MNEKKVSAFPRVSPGYAASLGARGYGLRKADLAPGQLEALRAACRVAPSSPPGGRPPPSFSVGAESPSKYYLPRALGLRLYGAPPRAADRVSHGLAAPELAFSGTLRESQLPAVEAFLAAARDPLRRGGVVNVGCGGGKTVMALYVAARLGRKTMVVVHKEFLMNQWRERIGQFLPEASVGRIQGPVVDVAGHGIVLCMLQTLCGKRALPPETVAEFGLVIIDECHHTSAQAFSKALRRTNCAYSLGLSATVKRKDGLGHVFQWFIGEVCYAARQQAQPVEVRRLEFRGEDAAYREEVFMFGARLNTARMVSNICAHLPRTRMIAALTVRAVLERGALEGRCKALVLSERRGHLVELERAIAEAAPPGARIETGYYVGGLDEAALKEAESRTVILGTFAMAAEGMDIPALDTLVLASPRSDIEQAVGRILRARPESRANTPLVLDVVDGFSVFAAMAAKRARFYKKNAYPVRP